MIAPAGAGAGYHNQIIHDTLIVWRWGGGLIGLSCDSAEGVVLARCERLKLLFAVIADGFDESFLPFVALALFEGFDCFGLINFCVCHFD